jgi:hypothetical protein
MQHAYFTGSKRQRARTWDRVLARLFMPAPEKIYKNSLKLEAVTLFLTIALNGRRIHRSYSEIKDLAKHKKASELQGTRQRMLKLTKFLGFHNEFFSQEIPIRNNALTWIHVLSAPEVISFVINGVGSLNCIAFEILIEVIIALIGSSMCLGVKLQKDVVSEGSPTRGFRK